MNGHPTVGASWYLRYQGLWTVASVSADAVTLRSAQGVPAERTVPLADFCAPGSEWFQSLGPMTWSQKSSLRCTADYLTERERQNMRDAGRGHLVRS